MTGRTRPGEAATQRIRLEIADEFRSAAHRAADGVDPVTMSHAIVTLLAHCAIAASDAICCARLKVYAAGENHLEAVRLLEQADRGSGAQLQVLLRLKSRAGYSTDRLTADDLKRAERATDALLAAAHRLT